MKDKSLSIALIVIFGLSGLAMLAAAWSMPFQHVDRVTACIGGSIGIGFALIRTFMLRHEKQAESRLPAVVEIRSNSDIATVRHPKYNQ